MSTSSRTASFVDDRPSWLDQLREATATPSPVSDILSDPSLMRVLTRPTTPRRSSSSSRQSSKTRKSSRSETPDNLPLLSLVLNEEGRQSNQLRSLLQSTTDRLEYEIGRAEAAEQRAEYAEMRVKQAIERLTKLTALQHQTELTMTRATEEAKRYKMMLDNAQAEMQRAQRDMDDLEDQKTRAETEARQARDASRQYERALREHEVKEIGHQDSLKQMANRFVDGVQAGRKEGYEAAKKEERARRKKLYDEAFEAGRLEGYDEGNAEGRAHERRNAMEAFDKFLENNGYSDDASDSSGSRTPCRR